MGEHITLKAADGFEPAAYVAMPGKPVEAGLVVVQEIFGVNQHIRAVTDKFAAHGYAAIAPAVFDRQERNVELGYQAEDAQRGMAIAQKLDWEKVMLDVAAAADYIRKSAERPVRVGIVGYCFGGSVAWMAAARLNIDAAVAYYGGFIAKMVDLQPKVPILLHFGDRDPHIPRADVDKIAAAHPQVPIYHYPADHGFNCDMRESYDASSAKLAFERTIAFFDKHLKG